MRDNDLKVIELKDDGDPRGFSYKIPDEAFEHIGHIKDIHCAQVVSNAVRGNHYHVERKELIQVFYDGPWTLGLLARNEEVPTIKQFSGKGSVLIFINPFVSHAIRNESEPPLLIIAYSSRVYRVDDTDSYPQTVL